MAGRHPPRVFVLEGPDGAGKTTLANSLTAQTGGLVVNQGPYVSDPYVETREKVNRYVRRVTANETVVFDRLHLGELVYGPIFRDGSKLEEREARMLHEFMADFGAIHILVMPALDTVRKNFVSTISDQLFKDVESIERVYRSYVRLYEKGWFHFHYDYESAAAFRPTVRLMP